MTLSSIFLSFAQMESDSILSDEAQQNFLDSILEKNKILLRSVDEPDIVYSGKDKTFYTMDVYDYGESGDQKYESEERVSGGCMYLKTQASGANNENECWVYNGKEFVFDGDSTTANITIKGDYSIAMVTNQYTAGILPGSTCANFKLVAEVYDMETGSRVGKRTIESEGIFGIWDTEYLEEDYNDGIACYLTDGHAYKVILKAEAMTKSEIDAHVAVNGYDNPRKIKISKIAINF
ncbi:hypothetical protein [Paramaledivibacter caminithermalis]|nr:hypothetical protein [Paramaledivibacter caminithermalis]